MFSTNSECPEKLSSLAEEFVLLIPETASLNFPLLITRHTLDTHPLASGKILSEASTLKLITSLKNADKHNAELKQAPVLSTFFYLIQQPLSISFIEDYYIETGLSRETAHSLAEFIFWSRLDRDDEQMEQLTDSLSLKKSPLISESQPEYVIPSDCNHAFVQAGNAGFTHAYGAYDPLNEKVKSAHKIIQLHHLDATNYLIEDEAHILLGLSLPLLTIMAATSGPLPNFNKWLKEHSSLATRTYISLGYMTECFYKDCLQSLNKDVAFVNLVSYNQESGFFQQPLHQQWNCIADSTNIISGLPLFLLLNKHQFTN